MKSNQCKEILRVVHETVEGILKDRKVRGVCRLSWLRTRAAAAFTSPAVAMKTDRNVRLITFGGMRASPACEQLPELRGSMPRRRRGVCTRGKGFFCNSSPTSS